MNDRDARRAAFIEERRQAGRASYSAILASAGDSAWDVVEPTHDRYLAGLLGLTRIGGTILDAACGTGKYWADIVASGRTVIGTDQLEGVLEVARAAHPDIPTARVALQDLAFCRALSPVSACRRVAGTRESAVPDETTARCHRRSCARGEVADKPRQWVSPRCTLRHHGRANDARRSPRLRTTLKQEGGL